MWFLYLMLIIGTVVSVVNMVLLFAISSLLIRFIESETSRREQANQLIDVARGSPYDVPSGGKLDRGF